MIKNYELLVVVDGQRSYEYNSIVCSIFIADYINDKVIELDKDNIIINNSLDIKVSPDVTIFAETQYDKYCVCWDNSKRHLVCSRENEFTTFNVSGKHAVINMPVYDNGIFGESNIKYFANFFIATNWADNYLEEIKMIG